MFRRSVCFSCVIVCLALAHSALAQEFSADVVSARKGNMGLNKLYVAKDKIRFEGQSENAAMGPTALVLDVAQKKYTMIMPQRHMYMDAPVMMTKPLITQFWRVDDPNDACPQWKRAAEEAGTYKDWGSCTKIGSDTLNGRSAVEYEGVSNKGEKSHIWVDSKLRCVVKTDEGTGLELRNIQEGSQPASLFEVPSGYTKFDMGSMMRQQQ